LNHDGGPLITMVEKIDLLETAIIEFYREEIRQRYQLECLRKVSDFETIPDPILNALREYILERLYPPPNTRLQMDEAFGDLAHLLRSPGRLTPLIATILTSMLRLSYHIPAVVRAGIATVDAITDTQKLETSLMEVAETMRPELERTLGRKDEKKYRQTMLRLICGIPESTVRGLIDNIIRLFGALSDVKMLSGILFLVERCANVMESRPGVYTDKDRESMKLCLEVLREGHALFVQLKSKDFPKLIKGIEKVETAWYQSVASQLKKPGMNGMQPETC
jgi:hypothetical protein